MERLEALERMEPVSSCFWNPLVHPNLMLSNAVARVSSALVAPADPTVIPLIPPTDTSDALVVWAQSLPLMTRPAQAGCTLVRPYGQYGSGSGSARQEDTGGVVSLDSPKDHAGHFSDRRRGFCSSAEKTLQETLQHYRRRTRGSKCKCAVQHPAKDRCVK